ncbi:MAG: flagellar basal body rod C-terminal domain-containing protein [Candidatus Sericytochromatia bacterium]
MPQQLTGHLSIFAIQSMKSIDSWMSTIQANLNGATRNAFKSSDIYYGSGAVNVFRDPNMSVNGIQIGEQALSVGHTKINWKQGEIVSSTQDQHMAILGDGFFAAVEPTNYATSTYNGTGTGSRKGYLLRDGEFHWATVPGINNPFTGVNEPILLTKEGLVVLMDLSDGVTNGSSDNTYAAVHKSLFDDPAIKARPSIVIPSYDAAGGTTAPTTVVDFDEIKYSRFGSTIYEAPTATSYKTIANGTNDVLDRRDVNDTFRGAILQQKFLEASNTNVNRNITELATLGKVYQGFVQVIKVYNTNLDEVLSFVK